jgi:hypothetical protein
LPFRAAVTARTDPGAAARAESGAAPRLDQKIRIGSDGGFFRRFAMRENDVGLVELRAEPPKIEAASGPVNVEHFAREVQAGMDPAFHRGEIHLAAGHDQGR